MRFDIYGHYQFDVIREGAKWKVFTFGDGKRMLRNDVIIPSAMACLRKFVEDATSAGLVTRAIERAGLRGTVKTEAR